jgi:hypothetical protein
MRLGRTMSPEVAERHAADKELAAGLRDRLADAQEAEGRLRSAQAEHRPFGGVSPLAIAYERALQAAILSADAAERVAMGPKTYEHGDAAQRRAAQIAARRARAKPSVRPYTEELERLRTLRERHKLTFYTSPSVAGSSSASVARAVAEPMADAAGDTLADPAGPVVGSVVRSAVG